jgi:hypothetical protein
VPFKKPPGPPPKRPMRPEGLDGGVLGGKIRQRSNTISTISNLASDGSPEAGGLLLHSFSSPHSSPTPTSTVFGAKTSASSAPRTSTAGGVEEMFEVYDPDKATDWTVERRISARLSAGSGSASGSVRGSASGPGTLMRERGGAWVFVADI